MTEALVLPLQSPQPQARLRPSAVDSAAAAVMALVFEYLAEIPAPMGSCACSHYYENNLSTVTETGLG
jgi:hypothetical protein